MCKIGFLRSNYDNCVYMNGYKSFEQIILLLYVDDILIAGKSKAKIHALKNDLSSEFEMKDMGDVKRVLGIDIIGDRNQGTIFMTQQRYLEKVLSRYGMSSAKSVNTPLGGHLKLSSSQSPETEGERLDMDKYPYANVVGSIMYSMICTRPDLAYSLSMVSRFMSNPGMPHWQALKWIMRYLRSSMGLGLLYKKREENDDDNDVIGYADSDHGGCLDSRRSMTAYIFTIYGNIVSWKASLQKVIATSTTESEYVAITEAVKEGLWLKGFLGELLQRKESVTVYSDNKSAICLIKNPVFHERTKHIDIKLHFVRDLVSSGKVKVLKIDTEENPADALTKVLSVAKFNFSMKAVHVVQFDPGGECVPQT